MYVISVIFKAILRGKGDEYGIFIVIKVLFKKMGSLKVEIYTTYTILYLWYAMVARFDIPVFHSIKLNFLYSFFPHTLGFGIENVKISGLEIASAIKRLSLGILN